MSVFAGIKPPEILLETSSKYNKSIKVLKVGDVLKLSVNNFIQSFSKNSKSAHRLCWGQAVDLIKKESSDVPVDKILVLGMGGGTMQHMLREQFPEAHIVSVEIDPVMVDIAREYFDIEDLDNHEIVVEDALRFVVEPQEHGFEKQSFDVIVVDTVLGDEFPDLGKSGNFLAAVKQLLVPGGLILFNRMYLDEHQESANTFVEYVENFFEGVDTHVVAGHTNSDNILIYGRS
ncbi:methyltransferase domain-containing protein [candidate division WWE3 bacterium]|nr:methyltransferase domain-containing protein [candidate division WWE3 bacterium]